MDGKLLLCAEYPVFQGIFQIIVFMMSLVGYDSTQLNILIVFIMVYVGYEHSARNFFDRIYDVTCCG